MYNKKANVIFILSDQHNAKVLGFRKHPNVQTPNLDKMAKNGVYFENAITQNPICTPSRVSFLSGQYCHNHGYYGLSGANPQGLPTILGHFKRNGYKTSAVGKIHCPEYWIEDDADNFHESCFCSIDGRSKKYSNFLEKCGKLDLEDSISLPDLGIKGTQSMEGCPSKLSFEESQEGWITDETIRFIKSSIEEKKPFFAHMSLPRPHQCTAPSEPFWSMYNEDDLVLPPNADYDLEGKAPHLKIGAENWRTENWALFEPKTFEAARLRKLHGYLGAISQVDHAVGKILNVIKDLNISENTIVVYSSDHGDYACEHGIMEKAPGICSDAITRIPMIWQWSEHLKNGHTAREIVEAVDVSTTLCSLCDIPLLETSDGKNISHLMHGETGEVHKIGVTEFPWSKSVRKGKYRFVYYPTKMFVDEYPNGFGELYDLEADPWEMKNLYFDSKHKNIIIEMQNDLTQWLITTTRPATVLQVPEFNTEQSITRYSNSMNTDGKISYKLLDDIALNGVNTYL